MTALTRIAVLGATGRMGRAVITAASASPLIKLGAAVDIEGHTDLGRDAGQLAGVEDAGVSICADLVGAVPRFDVLVDFTRPEGTLAALPVCVAQHRAMVIGTTGFTPEQKAQIENAAKTIPICMAANFSIGVNLCLRLLEQAAKALADDFDIEVVEAHHRHKVDARSQDLRGLRAQGPHRCARAAHDRLFDDPRW